MSRKVSAIKKLIKKLNGEYEGNTIGGALETLCTCEIGAGGGSSTDTHYDTRKVEEFIYEFDGNTEGKEVVEVYGSPFVKVSDKTFPIYVEDAYDTESSKYKKLSVNINTIGENEPYDTIDFMSQCFHEIVEGKIYSIEPEFMVGFVVLSDTEYEGMSFAKGVYLVADKWGVYASKLEVVAETGELKKLDEKYLPTGWGSAIPRIIVLKTDEDGTPAECSESYDTVYNLLNNKELIMCIGISYYNNLLSYKDLLFASIENGYISFVGKSYQQYTWELHKNDEVKYIVDN